MIDEDQWQLAGYLNAGFCLDAGLTCPRRPANEGTSLTASVGTGRR